MSPVRQQSSPLLGLSFPILEVFLFIVFTGILELLGFLHALHPALVVGGLGLIALFVTGRFMQVAFSPVGKLLVLFTIWFIICTPMGRWRGGSYEVFMDDWSKSFLAFILTAGLISTLAQAKKAFHTVAYSIGFLALLALGLHRYDMTGRLSLLGTRYGNANDLGFTLLLGVAFLSFMYSTSRMPGKIMAVFLALPILVALAKTGSRAGLLGAIMLVGFSFFQASSANRAKLVVLTPVIFVLLLLVVPANLRERYTTLFSSTSHTDMRENRAATDSEVEAANSAEARLTALKDSLYITMLHPFAGVGPGNFPVVQNDIAVSRGDSRGLWRVTHNTYTQISSEMGITGLVIYLLFIYQCWKLLTVIMHDKRLSSDLRNMAKTLRVALVVLMTVAIFDSLAYNGDIPIVAGLATALGFLAQSQRAAFKAKRAAAATAEPAVLPEPAPEPAWSASSLY